MNKKNKLTLSYTILLLVLAAVFVLSLSLGTADLSISELMDGIKGENKTVQIIITKIRLPRALASILAGSALAVCGCILQSVTANELCAPNIIGVNSGAGFGVILMLCFAPALWKLLPLAAFCGALIAVLTVMAISIYGNNKTKGSTVILSGVAVSSLFSAAISYLSLRYPDVLSSYTAFSVGGFSGVTVKDIAVPFLIIGIFILIAQLISNKLNILALGDDAAENLGVNVKLLRICALICAAALSGAAVSFAGLLGFVGLIVPNITRRLFIRDIRYEITLNALFGAIIVCLSDLIGRVLFAPSEIPCGIIMSLTGAPFFIYLIIKRRHHHGRM